jgi:hypothetical protein
MENTAASANAEPGSVDNNGAVLFRPGLTMRFR